MKRRRPKRHRSATARQQPAAPVAPNEAWAMDFNHDTLADGRTIRVLTAIDVFTRECVALEAASTFRGKDVARILGSAGAERGLPARIRVDHGTEFTSKALDHWAYWNRLELDFIRPGRPTDNPFIEAFNATLRRECLSQHWFTNLEDARRTLDRWKEDYNNTQPHSSLENLPPAHFRVGGDFIADRNRLQKLRC